MPSGASPYLIGKGLQGQTRDFHKARKTTSLLCAALEPNWGMGGAMLMGALIHAFGIAGR